MKTACRQRRPVQGSILLATLVVIAIVGIALGSYLLLIHCQNLSVARSQSWNAAMAAAEAGVEEALAHLNPGVVTAPPQRTDHGWTLGADNMYHPGAPRRLTNGYYNVAISYDLGAFPVIYSVGYARAPISSTDVSRTVEVRTSQGYLYPFALAAKLGIDLRGNNISIDSYDSADLAAFPGGRYNPANARDHGDVGTNDTMTNSFNAGNGNIKGKIRVGPGGVPRVGPNGSVGDSAWVNAGTRGLKPGWATDDMNMEFPDVVPPYTSGVPPVAGALGATNYTYLLNGGGPYMLPSFTLQTGKTLAVAPGENAEIYVTGNFLMQGSSFIYIPPDATLKVFVGGASATFTTVNTSSNANAASFQYYGLPSNTSVTWSGNSEYVGTVYAPSAKFTLGGSSANTYGYQGACVARSIVMNGSVTMHYDENLGRRGPLAGYVVTSWKEL